MHLDSASFSLNRLESLDPPSSGLCARSSSNTVSGKMAENPNPSKIGRRQKVQFVWCFYNMLPVSQIEELTLFHQSSVKEAEQGEGAVLEALVFGHAVSGGLALIFLHDRGVLDLGLVLLLVHAVVEVASDLVVCPVGEGALDLLEVSVILVNEGLEEGFFFSCPASGLSEELTLFHQSSVKEAEQGEGAVLEALVFGHAVSGGLALIFLHDRGVLDLGLVLLLVHAVVVVASDLVVCPVGEGALDLLEVSVVLVNEGLEEGFFFSCPASGLSSCHFDIMSGVNSFITMWVIQHRVTYLLFTFKFDLDQISHRKTA
ncbi:Hypothetical_protein [Hexamita inflata]|uniref:Hypothetical_protein n=1 Tax=Hexamita inflata TaxID=28002 RepID=A0AA86R5L1_9EUKA|nr:Hypothetical protein HINF_LOCUS54233 [Hexamita inflata]